MIHEGTWLIVIFGSAAVALFLLNLGLKKKTRMTAEKRHDVVGLVACVLFVVWLLRVFISA